MPSTRAEAHAPSPSTSRASETVPTVRVMPSLMKLFAFAFFFALLKSQAHASPDQLQVTSANGTSYAAETSRAVSQAVTRESHRASWSLTPDREAANPIESANMRPMSARAQDAVVATEMPGGRRTKTFVTWLGAHVQVTKAFKSITIVYQVGVIVALHNNIFTCSVKPAAKSFSVSLFYF